MTGRGGDGADREKIAAAAAATPDWQWIVIGMVAGDEVRGQMPPNVRIPGWIDDPLPYLAGADAVVSAAGHNSVMELAHARARTVLIPEPRPFDEQVRKAAICERERLAIVHPHWPEADRWPELLRAASELPAERWAAVTGEGRGAAVLAAAIEAVAVESESVV